MQNEKIHLERIAKFVKRLKDAVHGKKYPASARFIHNADAAIAYEDIYLHGWKDIACNEEWSQAWGSAWFLVTAVTDAELSGKRIGLYFDCDGEACVFKDGSPYQGLTPKVDWYHNAAKYFVPLSDCAVAGEEHQILIEAAANDLFGSGKDSYCLRECSVVEYNEPIYQLAMDMEILFDLAKSLPEGSIRHAKLVYGLNQVCNIWAEGRGYDDAKDELNRLLSQPANASALTAYSVGHAHLDLAWLWRIRESKRKGGRTFANALRLIESYPEYIFGASQAQLYKWIKELYPALYSQVQQQVRQGRWEVQGASWVEFDTNITGGESIIRQFMYGRAFFRREFGIVPNYLWLPDCFGFSANMPQFMKGCNVDYFITQKLSWNESNTFPHHLFIWQGIDGSEVKAHQLPTNDYNFSNNPSAFIATETRFAQADVADAYLNLYGIGDGGGGPTRNHLEYGLRQQNLEGCSKFRFSKAEDFLRYFDTFIPDALPKAYGELYLEFHRGTYTTQAKMKKQNSTCESLLRTAEALLAISAKPITASVKTSLQSIWEDTLLLQFHDILPGSSIGPVYQDAFEMGESNITALNGMIADTLHSLGNTSESGTYLVFNPAAGTNCAWLSIPAPKHAFGISAEACEVVDWHLQDDSLMLLTRIKPWSFGQISIIPQDKPITTQNIVAALKLDTYENILIENEFLRVLVSPMGSISSIFDKQAAKELLAKESNLLLLWEDEPNNWGAWDINHFYRETLPQQVEHAELISALGESGKAYSVCHKISIGKSEIMQQISLYPGERMLRFSHQVLWQEHHKMLRLSFSPDIYAEYATCGIQMGAVQRPTKPRNQWDNARFEFPAQGFVDLSDASKGCSLICTEKYGYSVKENTIEMALLRSPADVDPEADMGHQEYSYAFYCHASPFADAHVAETADAFGTQLKLSPCEANPGLPLGQSFCFENSRLILKHIKPAEDGKGIILRCFEPIGSPCSDTLVSRSSIAKLSKCNMLEETLCELPVDAPITAKAFEIITLRLEFAK
jgi:alpha-mannosidase